MMDCKEFREALDLYVDGELSAESLASGSAHLHECGACQRAADELQRLRRALRTAVRRHDPPPDLLRRLEHRFGPPHRAVRAAILTVAVALFMAFGVFTWPPASGAIAGALERVAVRLDTPRTVVLEGQLVCRDCVLQALYGAKTMCHLKGHHPALRTADGRIWTLMEGSVPTALIDDAPLQGHRVRIRGRLYRRASCIEVESYELL
jgi:hypothetical protein